VSIDGLRPRKRDQGRSFGPWLALMEGTGRGVPNKSVRLVFTPPMHPKAQDNLTWMLKVVIAEWLPKVSQPTVSSTAASVELAVPGHLLLSEFVSLYRGWREWCLEPANQLVGCSSVHSSCGVQTCPHIVGRGCYWAIGWGELLSAAGKHDLLPFSNPRHQVCVSGAPLCRPCRSPPRGPGLTAQVRCGDAAAALPARQESRL